MSIKDVWKIIINDATRPTMLMIEYHYRLFSVSNGAQAKADNVIQFEFVRKNK